MTSWTQAAREELERYWSRTRTALAGSGADTTEVIDDLQRHIDEEVCTARLGVVTGDDVKRILRRIGEPASPLCDESEPESGNGASYCAPARPKSKVPRQSRAELWLLIFGVLLPAGTLGFEFFTHACASTFFDPIPTIWHVLLVASVPLVNGLVWLALRREWISHLESLGLANAFVIGVAAFYALLLLPITPFAFVGIIVYGLGLVPLSPLIAFALAIRLRWHLRRLAAFKNNAPLSGFWPGLGLALLVLTLIVLPDVLTKVGLQMANSSVASTSERGLRWLRAAGTEQVMLRACYERPRLWMELLSPLTPGDNPVTQEDARKIYFRVTGQPFNAVPPPRLYVRGAQWSVLEDSFAWDSDTGLGGDTVAGRVKGLSLAGSRIDGVVEQSAALGYFEWTMEFKNVAPVQREARAQIALPPGAVVSRLTLWVNGEEREAAFAGRGQVREAYQKVAVQQRRDPVLVTTSGPDRVLMQCFPVPANGGVMKVRLGITAPLVLDNAAEGWLRWPGFLERNFSLTDTVKHAVWLESKQPVQSKLTALKLEPGKEKMFVLRGELTERELSEPHAAVRVQRAAAVRQVWTPADESNHIIRQSIVEKEIRPPSRVVIVVDGSQSMKSALSSVAEALARLPDGLEFSLLLATDQTTELSGAFKPSTRAVVAESAERLRRAKTAGGQDNVPALVRAWDWAAASTNGVVVWVHGPQPVMLDNAETLRQRFDRQPGAIQLLDIQTRPGPNRVLEKLSDVSGIHSVARFGSLDEDLGKLFANWSGQRRVLAFVREQLDPARADTSLKKGSKHIARLWAYEQVLQLATARRLNEAVELAARYQLVTPVSGAVVLETKEQYRQAGLVPVDAATVPAIPEPETWILLGAGLVVLWFRLRYRSKLA